MPGEELLIGREAERAALDALAAGARAGDGAIVLLAGEAGVGKTRLARTVLAGSGLEVAMGFGVQEGASAYGPIQQERATRGEDSCCAPARSVSARTAPKHSAPASKEACRGMCECPMCGAAV